MILSPDPSAALAPLHASGVPTARAETTCDDQAFLAALPASGLLPPEPNLVSAVLAQRAESP